MDWHLAEINVARARAPLDDPLMAGFVAQLEAVNRLAEESRGFVWRLTGDDGVPSSYLSFGDDPRIIVNMSLWTSLEALHAYVYRSHHVDVFRDRRRWFEPLPDPLALFWVPAGHRPSLDEGRLRLDHLRRHGPTATAFSFKRPFPPEAWPGAGTPRRGSR